jgi:hypothetical protein
MLMLTLKAAPASAQSTITTAVPFLLISPDSRASGMGETGVAVADNVNAVYWNPAGYGFQRGVEFNFTHSNWLPAFNADLYFDYLAAKFYVKDVGMFGLGLTILNLGTNTYTNDQGTVLGTFQSYEFAITGSYARQVSSSLSLGVSLRYIRSKLSNASAQVGNEVGNGSSGDVSFDLGALWKPELGGWFKNRMSFGLNISNLGPSMFYIDQAQADPLPTNFRFGLASKVLDNDYNKFTVTLDFNKLLVRRANDEIGTPDPWTKAIFSSWTGPGSFRQITTGVGFEYWYGKPALIALRGGYFYEDPNYGNRKYFTFGAGIRYAFFGADFSYIDAADDAPLAGTVRLSLLISMDNFGTKKN